MQNPTKPVPPKPVSKKSEAGDKWYSNEPSKKDEKAEWSLEELFLFDPNFESCW